MMWCGVYLRISLVCAAMAGFRVQGPTRAAHFAGGTGEPNDPYQIATAEQFRLIGRIAPFYGSCFILTDDIDLAGSGEELHVDVGERGFQGVLDGNGHVIRNLVTKGEPTAPAIFAVIDHFGIVRNLTIENCFVFADSGSVVAVLCEINRGQILNCHAANCVIETGSITDGDGGIGALAGINQGLLEDCGADGVNIVCKGTAPAVGGLVGRNLGIVRRCGTQGSIFGPTVGGLVGANLGEIDACCAKTAVVMMGSYVTMGYYDKGFGGLVGFNQGRIDNCYATGSIGQGARTGGLVGQHQSGQITHCYSTGLVSFHSYAYSGPVGWLVGEGSVAPVRHCYYLSFRDPNDPPKGPGTPLSLYQMMQRGNYAGWEFVDEDAANPWLMPDSGFPRLVWEFQEDIPVVSGLDVPAARAVLEQHGWSVGEVRLDYSRSIAADRVISTFPNGKAMPETPIDIIVSQGPFDWSTAGMEPDAGTAAHPFQIRTAGQLEALGDWAESHSKHFELIADIDMGGRMLSRPLLGAGEEEAFAGTLQGNGFEISKLAITVPRARSHKRPSGELGMVGYLADSGRIDHLSLTQVAIAGPGALAAGALVGLNQGAVQRCHVRGYVVGTGEVGALAGRSQGLLEQCSARGIVGGQTAGGLVGQNSGVVDECFTDTAVVAEDSSGGLIGHHLGQLTDSYSLGIAMSGTLAGVSFGEIRRCYAAGWIADESSWFPGVQMVGERSDTQVADCYYLIPSGYEVSNDGLGTGLIDLQMQYRPSFLGWDFWGIQTDGLEDIWVMPSDGYPQLRWQYGAGSLVAVPLVSGLPVDEALSRLRDAGLAATVRYEYDDGVAVDYVVQTYANATREGEMTLELIVSSGPYDWADNPGDGSETDPFEIALASHLLSLADHPELWDRSFMLTTDIDLGWVVLDRAMVAADVNTTDDGFQGPRFNGTLDGAGHHLANLTIDGPGDCLGLFGALGPAARISHLYMDDVCILGTAETEYAGPIAGISEGTVEDCHTGGCVRGCYPLGRFVGDSTGVIEGCTSTVELIGVICHRRFPRPGT